MTNAIDIEALDFSFGEIRILEKVDLHIHEGDFVGLVGPNGGGKTTLLKLILGLLEPDGGNISIFGKDPDESRHLIGYVPQYATFSREFPITVEQVVLMGNIQRTGLFSRYRREQRAAAKQAMQTTGITELANRNIGQLSGGQQQRVLVARALVSNPKILLLDEPTANVDQRGEEDIFDLLKRLNKAMTIIVVSHDIGFISEYVNTVACLNRTMLMHDTACLTGKNIDQLYHGHVHMIDHLHQTESPD